jgi:threonine/homoserine/homoserine lactone efflux protein
MSWVYAELVAVSIAAMLSPTTLTFSVLAVVLAKRPVRTGLLFYIGALTTTLAIGILAAFVLGDVASSDSPSTPKTWVAVLDLVGGSLLLWYAWHLHRHPIGADKQESMVAQMRKVASSPAIAVVGAGAALANPGGYIPIALKTISETDPSAAQYAVEWIFFALVSLLPLLTAIVLLVAVPTWAGRLLDRTRVWLQAHLTLIAIVIIALLAVSLLRGGIAGLTD